MRVRSKELDASMRVKILDALYTAAGTVNNRNEAKDFLKGLLTEGERIMLGKRILIARSILAGKTYDEIVGELNVGKDTILRITRWLEEQMPGYEEVLEKVDEEFEKREAAYQDKKLYATSALYRLKKKYPMHFLLFPMPKAKK